MIQGTGKSYEADVATHYDELDEIYRGIWRDGLHHGLWDDDVKSREEASERLLTFLAVVYMQVISSFECFLSEFRAMEMGTQWLIIT